MNNKQRGSISWFVIIAIVLVTAMALVLYGAKQFMMSQQSPISDDTVAVNNTDQAKKDNNQSQGSGGKDQKTAPTESSNSSTADQRGDAQDVPQSQQNSTGGDNLSKQGTQENANLPTTGPEDSFMAVVAGGMVFGVVSYIRSRRTV